MIRLVHDEQGNPSSARVLLWVTVSFTGVVIWRHLGGVKVDNAVWGLLGTAMTIFSAWAAGPRVAQYLLPQVGAVAQGLGAALKAKAYGPNTEPFDDGVG